MPNAEIILNEAEPLNDAPPIPAVHAVLGVVFGSTKAELPLLLEAQCAGVSDLVPWRVVVVDSLPYDGLVARLIQQGWTRAQVREALPPAHYFQLESPFTADFDFDHPLNEYWRDTIFDPTLRRLASKPDDPGCAGTPALGRARVVGHVEELRAFFERHVQALTRIRPETLALRDGVLAFVVTTYRGGTGTGVTLLGSAILRSVLQGGEIHLQAAMPCVYGGDTRAYANAFAMLRETQGAHRYGAAVAIPGHDSVPVPFTSASYTFASNGAVTLTDTDALLQTAALLRAYLRVPSQAVIMARRVDLTDVTPYDLEDLPMHVRQHTALSIRTLRPGVQEYLATEWIRQELAAVQERFEAWYQTKALTAEEEARVTAVVERAVTELRLHRSALLARLEPTPAPLQVLHTWYEQLTSALGTVPARAIKAEIAALPEEVRQKFVKFEQGWEAQMHELAQQLPKEIATYVMDTLTAQPHLALVVLARLQTTLARVADDAGQDAKLAYEQRENAAQALGAALRDVQEAHGIFWLFHTREVVGNAAAGACEIALAAALARVQQQQHEALARALTGELSTLDKQGKPEKLSNVTTALETLRTAQIAVIRTRQAALREALQQRLDALGQQLTRRSPIFECSLVRDDLTREQLAAEVQRLRTRVVTPPAMVAFLAEQRTLPEVCAALLPLLPSYAESGRSLTEILMQDAGKQRRVVELLGNQKPFAPLALDVEDQQGLRNRRDHLTILELPGGQDGSLATLLLREGIVKDRNAIVEAGTDEIRFYTLREGLPYAALLPLKRYQPRYRTYLAKTGAITPHTQATAHQLPDIAPARTNFRTHTEALLYTVKAVLPECLAPRPSGGFILRYETRTEQGFAIAQEESFPDFQAVVGWVATRVELRKALEAKLRKALDTAPAVYTQALMTAWQQAAEPEKAYLQQALYALQIDPHRPPTVTSTNGHRPRRRAPAGRK